MGKKKKRFAHVWVAEDDPQGIDDMWGQSFFCKRCGLGMTVTAVTKRELKPDEYGCTDDEEIKP